MYVWTGRMQMHTRPLTKVYGGLGSARVHFVFFHNYYIFFNYYAPKPRLEVTPPAILTTSFLTGETLFANGSSNTIIR